jgi:hypothetical protein
MQVRVSPNGVLDKDSELAFVQGGNYSDALNIRHRNADGQNFGGVMPIKGNVNAITQVNNVSTDALTYSSSTESYRIYIDVTDIALGNISSHEAELSVSANGFITPLAYFNYNSTTAANAYTAITSALTSIRNTYNLLPAIIESLTFTYGSFVNTDPTPNNLRGYFILTSNLAEFNLTIQNIAGTYFSIEKETEYVASNGTLSIIGSVQLDDDLFVLSAGSAQNGDGTSIVSEVAVIYPVGSGYHYTTLLRSKQLRFHKERNAEIEVERLGSQINLYWTDNLNPPRYIELPYANKRVGLGLLISRGGTYQLSNIAQEAQLILANTSAYIEDIQVLEGAGSLRAGNKRYTGRFVTDDFTYSDFLYPTNPVNIYNAVPSIPFKIAGDNPTVLTGKGVEMVLKNIPQGIYSYFDLVALEYIGDTYEPILVQRFAIDENASELKIRHTNRGQTNETLAAAELFAISSKYLTAKSLKLFDNRMTLSNLTEQLDLNLEAWAATFTHSLETAQIPSVGIITEEALLSQNLDYQLGEYLDPNNTLLFTSYMMNDTYRFGVQVQWKDTAKWSAPYWVDDIRFDTLVDNVNAADDRRTTNNINTNLTDSAGENVNIYYVKFGNINLDYLVDGTPIRDLIKTIRFVRAERIPEVLASGYFLPGTAATSVPNEVFPYHPSSYFDSSTSTVIRRQYPFGSLPSLSVDNSEYLFFYSPDVFYSGFEYDFNQSTDSIKILGVPNLKEIITSTTGIYGGTIGSSSYSELGGYFYSGAEEYFTISYTTSGISITNHKTLNPKEETVFTKTIINGASKASNQRCQFFKLGAKLYNQGYFSNPGANLENIGVYYGQIFRDLGANLKYPVNKRETVYQSTGHLRFIKEGENGLITENVFGGDIFNQKSHYLLRMPDFRSPNWGDGAGFSIYSQNVLNTSMFEVLEHDGTRTGDGYIFPQSVNTEEDGEYFVLSSTTIETFPTDTLMSGLAHFMEQWPEVYGQNQYNNAYNHIDQTLVETGYDNTSTYDGSRPATIAYSSAKVIGSTKNGYRYFQPTNIADLDLTNGEIAHHDIINDNFYTFQERSVQRQYFRDASLVNGGTGSDIVVGIGTILGTPGQELTSMGTTKKTSIIKGKNPNGKDTAYWYNDRLQKLLRLAGDGVSVISDRGLSSYLLNNGKYISNEFYPLSGRGIHGVWNDKYSEAVFTFKYNDGTNKAFTVVYDEIKNGFSSFHSYYPNIYLPYNNGFFSVNPGAQNTIFIHDGNNNYTFYGAATEPFVEVVMNYDSNLSKNFEAVQINSDLIPFGSVIRPITFATKRHVSYLENADFDSREDYFYSTIKNDSTATGINSGDTSRLHGKWLKMKISLASNNTIGSQKLINAIVKFRPMPRLYNQ